MKMFKKVMKMDTIRKQETEFNAEIRVQDNAEKVFKQILPELKTLTFKNFNVVGESGLGN